MSQADHVLDGIFSAELETTNDVQSELRLNTGDLRTLQNMAERGGEIPWSWNVKQESRDVVERLILGEYVKEIEYCTHATDLNPRLMLRLTDKARNVIEKNSKMRVNIGTLRKLTG